MFRRLDFIMNSIFPILVGSIFYLWEFNYILRCYLPDGLWAYALTSMLLIIWNRNYNKQWLYVIAFTFCIFEILQYLHIIPGTADYWDVIVYFVFFFLALLINLFIKLKTNYYEN